MSVPIVVLYVNPDPTSALCYTVWRDSGASDPVALRVSPQPTLPCISASVGTVVLAGVLEWLDAAEAYGLLLDCHRVLAADGQLVLDLPDAEAALAAWHQREAHAGFDPEIAAATAATCCTYWRELDGAEVAPEIDPRDLTYMLDRWTPFRLAIALRDSMLDRLPRLQQARRSAWSRAELVRDLQRVGFTVRSFNDEVAAVALAARPDAPVAVPGADRLWCVAAPVFSASQAGMSAPDELRECQQALELQAGHAFRHYRLLWARFGRALATPDRGPIEPSFAAHGYAIAQLPWSALVGFHASLAHAQSIQVNADDFAPGYAHNDALSPESQAGINQSSRFLALGHEQRRQLAPVLCALSGPVHACLGTGFRVLNARCWRTATSDLREEPQSWHKDELFPHETIKAMIYLSAAGGTFGSTELAIDHTRRVIPEGPPGTVLLFRNGVVTHRGVPPSGDERIVLELTLSPWPQDDLRVRCAGLNAEFAIVPWSALEAI
jgi:hypothetical protein